MAKESILYEIATHTYLKLEFEIDKGTSKHLECEVQFEIPQTREFKHLKFKNGQPTETGLHSSTLCLIAGIAKNIQYGHEKKLIHANDHISFVIAELQKEFDRVIQSLKVESGNKLTIIRPDEF